jgi:hypothetical protein
MPRVSNEIVVKCPRDDVFAFLAEPQNDPGPSPSRRSPARFGSAAVTGSTPLTAERASASSSKPT